MTPPPFCLKSSFGEGGVIIFIPNVDPLLGLAYPENLISIGLMVEAVDEFCGRGRGRGRVAIIYTTSAQAFAFDLALALGLS